MCSGPPSSNDQLPLFQGAQTPQSKLEQALDALDLAAAVDAAPPEWRRALKEMAWSLEGRNPGSVEPERLACIDRQGWPPPLERTWQRLMGRALDGHGIPGVLAGEPAAAFLLRAGELERAEASIRRHLFHHPRDPEGWRILARFDPVHGAVRCAWHGGPVLDAAAPAADAVLTDGLAPVEDWLLLYAWFLGHIDLAQVEEALAVEGDNDQARLPLSGQGRTFTAYLVAAEHRRLAGGDTTPLLEALGRISPLACQRYLSRLE